MFAKETYRSRYSQKHPGEYWILDNGVAEDIHVDGQTLSGLGNQIRANEIVMPDAMLDCDKTLEMSRKFVREVWGVMAHTHKHALAGVVQGNDFQEWMKCINAYFHWPEFKDTVTTLMFPRCMNSTASGSHTRFHFLNAMFTSPWWAMLCKIKQVEVHCLGASSWIKEVAALADLPIRSMDTSLPVVLGLDGINIRQGIYIKRQDNFFDIEGVQASFLEVINDNVRTYRDWAGDKTAPSSFV